MLLEHGAQASTSQEKQLEVAGAQLTVMRALTTVAISM
jgi:hypothetical protein